MDDVKLILEVEKHREIYDPPNIFSKDMTKKTNPGRLLQQQLDHQVSIAYCLKIKPTKVPQNLCKFRCLLIVKYVSSVV